MNKFSASKTHILGHMLLSRRKSRGEADGHKFCQKVFREALLHTVIPWCKLTSISPCQRFCDTAAALPAGLRGQLLCPACLETSPVCSVTDLSSWIQQEDFLSEPHCWNTLHVTWEITWPWTLPQRHPAGRFVCEIFSLLYTEKKAVASKA